MFIIQNLGELEAEGSGVQGQPGLYSILRNKIQKEACGRMPWQVRAPGSQGPRSYMKAEGELCTFTAAARNVVLGLGHKERANFLR